MSLNFEALKLASLIKAWWQDEGYLMGTKPPFVLAAEKILDEEF